MAGGDPVRVDLSCPQSAQIDGDDQGERPPSRPGGTGVAL